MSEQEYLDPQRWPATTQTGLSYQKQRMIDSYNYDELAEMVEAGEAFSQSQQARWAELRQKLGR